MRIFLSYRREDASAWAGRLTDALAVRFGAENIFQDVTALRPGVNYLVAIDEAVRRSDVALVVIGPDWLTAAHADGSRRLADESDDVRAEVRSALASAPLVIPVLVGGARMPTGSELPVDLAPVALLQAVTIRDETWHRDVDELVSAIGGARPAPGRLRWPLAVGTGAVALIVAVVAVLWLRRDADNGRTLGQGPSSAVSVTTLDPRRPIDECPSVAGAGWVSLGLTGTAPIGDAQPTGRLEITGIHWRGGGETPDFVVDARYTNFEHGSEYQYWWLYSLVADGRTVQPACFNKLGGIDGASDGEHTDVRIGFDLVTEPAAGTAVVAEVNGRIGRVELRQS
jgi:TIR domain